MNEKNRIPKLVLTTGQIDSRGRFMDLSMSDTLISCYECNGNIFYIEKVFGVVVEEYDYGIMGNRSNRQYRLTEVGLVLHCAECGDTREHYDKWFYPEDKQVLSWFDLEDESPEYMEIDYCLRQFNQKGDFTPLYKCSEVNVLKEKLLEYEKKHPLIKGKKYKIKTEKKK